MKTTPVIAGAMRTACALALFTAAACQLNDTDSAPPAPDDDETESATSPAQIGPVSAAQSSPSSSANAGSDAGTSTSADAGQTGGDAATPAVDLTDAALNAADASSTPILPVLPGLEAGVLPPGNLSPPADAAVSAGD